MAKKDIDWGSLGFGYVKTDLRYVSNYKDGKWDDGTLTSDENIVLNESAGVLQYAQTCFEGMKAYRTADGRVVCFRPDLNAKRMADTARRLVMPVFPEEKYIEAILKTIKANMEANSARPIPTWLERDAEKLTGKVIKLASREDVDIPVEEHLIVELYSK